MNHVMLIGRIATDPEVRSTTTGSAVANFRIAVDRHVAAGEEKKTDFIDVVAWQRTAEFVGNYLGKGRLIAVHGRLGVNTWTTQEGEKRSKLQVHASEVKSLDRPKNQTEDEREQEEQEQEQSE